MFSECVCESRTCPPVGDYDDAQIHGRKEKVGKLITYHSGSPSFDEFKINTYAGSRGETAEEVQLTD